MKNTIRTILLAAIAATFLSLFAGSAFSYIDLVYPQMNSQIFPANDNLFIRFTYDMNGSTINSSSVILSGSQSGRINAVVYYDAYLKTAFIDPVRNMQPGEKVRLILTSEIQTLSGYSIGDGYKYWFKVKPTGGTGDFTGTILSQLTTLPITSMNSGDFDSDGDLDLLVTVNESNGNNLFVYKNDGTGRFTDSSAKIILEPEFTGTNVWDFDNDGDLDVLCKYSVYWGSFSVKLYKNNGAGEFTYYSTVNNYRVRSMEIGDINNDGNIDIAVLGEHMIYFYMNYGDGVFWEGSRIWVACQYYYMSVGGIVMDDFDGDGDPDIYYRASFREEEPGYNCSVTRLFLNNGNGGFDAQIPGLYYYPDGSITDDMNGDRKIDIMIPFYNVMMFYQSGSVFNVHSGIGLYTTGDFDADGDLDLINGGAVNESPVVHYNNGEGYFTSSGSVSAESQGGGFPCGDFDGDGDLDLLKGGLQQGEYVVYQNFTTCSIEGPSIVNLDSTMIRFHTTGAEGYWLLTNNPPCNASIEGVNTNDTVYVNSGSSEGSFVLNFYFPDNTLRCSRTISIDNPLPAELNHFSYSVTGRNVQLEWTTSSELNNSGFEVQRTSGTGNWTVLGFVKGNGTLNTAVNFNFNDKNLETGIYNYRLKQIDFNGNYKFFGLSEAVTIGVPDRFYLDQNYPNPFNPLTTIAFGIPEAGNVMVKVFDMSGREIKTLISEYKDAGYFTVKFDGSSLASGTYFYRIECSNYVSVKKMILLK